MAINGRNYGSSGPSAKMTAPIDEKSRGSSKALNLGKMFGIMFIWLLFTAGIAFGLGFAFFSWMTSGGYTATNPNPNAVTGLWGVLIASGIGLIILTFVIQFFALKKGKGMIVLSSLYVLFMGVLCSSLVLFIDWRILGIALGITSIIFGVLAVIGLLAKNVKPMAMVGMMLIFGAAITALVTWLVILFTGITGTTATILWVVDFALFAGMLLLIIVDLNQIGKICERGEVSTNITLYCALSLYTDFIYIFIRIAYFLAIALSKK